MIKEIIIAAVIVAGGVACFLFRFYEIKRPLFTSVYISFAIFFAYNVLQPSLGFPAAPTWILVVILMFHIVAEILFSLYKDQKKNEQAQIEQQTIE